MGYYEKNCSDCDNWFGDQCSKCAAAEKSEKDSQTCSDSKGRVLQIDCKLSSTSAKRDFCSSCGYEYIYP